jgi:hypothetical protein
VATILAVSASPAPRLPNSSSCHRLTRNGVKGRRRAERALKELWLKAGQRVGNVLRSGDPQGRDFGPWGVDAGQAVQGRALEERVGDDRVRIIPGKNAVKWTRLSYHDFTDNQVRLQLFALAYNLGNFLRRLALPTGVKHWSLTTLREKLIKIGAKVVTHARYVIFQMAEVAVPRGLFRAILERIRRLRPPSVVLR